MTSDVATLGQRVPWYHYIWWLMLYLCLLSENDPKSCCSTALTKHKTRLCFWFHLKKWHFDGTWFSHSWILLSAIMRSKMSVYSSQWLIVSMNTILCTPINYCVGYFWMCTEYSLKSLSQNRQPGEPIVENGLIPYLGCALQFGANPLQFLRSRQKKYGNIFTCKIAGQYIHFLCDPFSYHSIIRQGRHLDWRKFHFDTSVKVNLFDVSFYHYSTYVRILFLHPITLLPSLTRPLAMTASTLAMATPQRTSTKPFWRPYRVRLYPPWYRLWWATCRMSCWSQTHSVPGRSSGRWTASLLSVTRSVTGL